MKPIRRTLFATDFSKAASLAYEYAVYVADVFECDLHVLHADHFPDEHDAPLEHYLVRDERDWSSAFSHHVASLKVRDDNDLLMVFAEVEGLSAASTILKYADLNDIDLIVLGTHGRRGISRVLMGSTSQEVSRLATCSVLTVGGNRARFSEPGFKRILAPIDFSPPSEEAVEEATFLAGRFGATIEIIHVLQDVVYPVPYGVSFPTVTSPEVTERTEKAVHALASKLREQGVDAGGHVIHGVVDDKITQFADQNEIDLIVIHSRGQTGLQRFLHGSVTEHVLRTAPCPVLTIK